MTFLRTIWTLSVSLVETALYAALLTLVVTIVYPPSSVHDMELAGAGMYFICFKLVLTVKLFRFVVKWFKCTRQVKREAIA